MLNAFCPEWSCNIFPKTLFCGRSFRCSMAALEEIQPELENRSQTCSQSSDTMFHCFSAHDAFLDGCVRSLPSNSICQRVIFRKKCLPPTSNGAKLAGLDVLLFFYVTVANRTHSQGQSAALRTCRICKMFRSEAGAQKKKSWPIVHFSVFP